MFSTKRRARDSLPDDHQHQHLSYQQENVRDLHPANFQLQRQNSTLFLFKSFKYAKLDSMSIKHEIRKFHKHGILHALRFK